MTSVTERSQFLRIFLTYIMEQIKLYASRKSNGFELTSLAAAFQPHKDDGRMIVKGCAKRSPV